MNDALSLLQWYLAEEKFFNTWFNVYSFLFQYVPKKCEREKGAFGSKRLKIVFMLLIYHFLEKMIIYFKKEATIRWGIISKIQVSNKKYNDRL